MTDSPTPFFERLLPAPRDSGLRMEEWWVWCGSIVKDDDGRYHMFASRWPRYLIFFTGYQVASEIVHAVSDTVTGPYTFRDVVLGDRGEGYWDGRVTHNPTVIRLKDRYLLFYIGGTYSGDRPTSEEIAEDAHPKARECYRNFQIGVAEASSPDGPWRRSDRPVLSPRPGKWDAAIVTNPAPCVTPDGRILLYYRSNTPFGCRLGVAGAPRWGQPFECLRDDPILQPEKGMGIEDPYVWWSRGRYELIAKDLSGKITGELHAGVHATSDDGVAWTLSANPKAYSRSVVWEGGETEVMGCLERPQLLVENMIPQAACFAAADGPGGFRNASNTWNVVIPLRTDLG